MKSYMRFAASPSEAVRVATVVLIDCSPSMEENDWKPSRLAAAQEATKALIEEKRRQSPEDYVGIVSFGGHAEVEHALVPVGRNAAALIACLKKIKVKGSTNIDAGLKQSAALLGGSNSSVQRFGVWSAVENLLLGRPSGSSVPVSCDLRHIICLSDGSPTDGNTESRAAAVKKDGILIDCIGIASRDCVDETVLKAVASEDEQGHPRYRFIGDEEALVKEFRSLASHIRVMR